jgi:2-polyprenyl-3-methyl-5-hydroxy-6-metoxy-1,4-benzoquinol methylase
MINLDRGRNSLEDYLKYRKRRSKEATKWLSDFISLQDKSVLDIGCGHGSNASVLADLGAKVRAIDIDRERIETAKKYNSHINIRFSCTDLSSLAGQKFDVITLFDVLEHVNSCEAIIDQAAALLEKDGILYIEITPYYSITGHHLYDYTFLPVQFFPLRWTKWLIRRRSKRGGIFSADDALKQFIELNGITCRNIRKLCYKNKLKAVFQRNEINIHGVLSVNTSFFRYLPFLEDLLSPAYILLLKKNKF